MITAAHMGWLDPQAKRPVTLDLGARPWLRTGDTVLSADVTGDGVNVTGENQDDTNISFFVSPSVTSGKVSATVHVVTTEGEEDDFTMEWTVNNT